jgi:hypothetical protein
MGYAFINFTHPYYTQMFAYMFHGTRIGHTTSAKVVDISASRRQGLIDNLDLFRGSDLLSSFSHPYFKPFVQVPSMAPSGDSITPILVPLDEEVFHSIMMPQ